jgi:hypothetical protein
MEHAVEAIRNISNPAPILLEHADLINPAELAATVPPVGAANTGSLAIAKLLQWADVALKGTLAYDSLSLFIHEQRQASA